MKLVNARSSPTRASGGVFVHCSRSARNCACASGLLASDTSGPRPVRFPAPQLSSALAAMAPAAHHRRPQRRCCAVAPGAHENSAARLILLKFASSRAPPQRSEPVSSSQRKPTRSLAGFANAFGSVTGWMSPNWLRWHALLGVVPLAGYLLVHLLGQVLSLSGSPVQRWLQDLLERSPLALSLELLLVYAPLVGHAALGGGRVARSPSAPATAALDTAAPDTAAPDTAAPDTSWAVPWGSALQRLSALALLVFLVLHV